MNDNSGMIFKRKAYDELLKWKASYANSYAVLLEGPRRVGKSTIAESFAKNEYKSYVLLDFSKTSKSVRDLFDDLSNLDLFFLRLQAETGVALFQHESLVIFDEVQLFPKARQAIKHLVHDGRYHYLETGSFISIRKNVKDILIPSEEMKISVFPMDYEEFCWATKKDYELLNQLNESNLRIGEATNRTLMRRLRLYMAVGGMPQAVESYLRGDDFTRIDAVKREIIHLYESDFKKIDSSGKISSLYHSIPAHISQKQFRITQVIGGRKSAKFDEYLYDLVDSKTVLPCFRMADPSSALSQGKDPSKMKLYLSDTGLFVTLMFMDRPSTENEIYAKLLSDKLEANLGSLYENLVAQMIAASGRELYYYTWKKEGSTHDYEVDFLISKSNKLYPIEVKSARLGKHESITAFAQKYSQYVGRPYLVSSKERGNQGELVLEPFYLLPFLLR